MLLLYMYNITFLVFCVLVVKDMQIAFLTGFLASFVTLLFLTGADIFKDIQQEEKKLICQEKEVLKMLRSEYQKTHTIKQKMEILSKANFIFSDKDNEQNKNIDSSTDPGSDIKRKVFLSYLNRISTGSSHEQKKGGHH